MEKFYVTTPIYYINDEPHIGTAYTTIAADILARWHRLKGFRVFFLTGLDENSVKTVRAAKQKGFKDIQAYADEMAGKFIEAWKLLNISYDGFIRTTEERHKKFVKEFFQKVNEKGLVYKGSYEGLYCEDCECFKTENELVNGLCPDHKKPPKKLSEENYFFKLSSFEKQLLELFRKNSGFVFPESRKNEVANFIKQGLLDISISRPGLEWGIPFPLDEKHRFWVWFDALNNYLSACPEGYWPADIHLMAKDIMRFHAVIWPAMLQAAGYKLPKKIVAHGFLTINGARFSKTLGNVISPKYLTDKYGVDALRYHLFREIPFGQDGDFNEAALKTRINSDLGNDLGNLLQRTLTLIEKKSNSIIPSSPKNSVVKEAMKVFETVDRQLTALEFHRALETIWAFLADMNKLVNETEPWNLPPNSKELNYVLSQLANSLAFTAFLVYAFMPSTAERILEQLGLKGTAFNNENLGKAKAFSLIPENTKIGEKKVLFPRIK